MKKIFSTILFLVLIMVLTNLFSNPIVVRFINEFMITEEGWKLELHSFHGQGELYSLDGGCLTSSTDTAYFKEGITFYLEDYTVITNENIETDLEINPDGDVISICFGEGEEEMEDQIYFGVEGYYVVPALNYNQSINLFYYMDQGWSQEGYYLDNSPTFGFENDTINANGNIAGFVKDSLDNPIEGVKVIYGYGDIFPGLPIYVVTNSEGYFNLRGLSTFKRLEFEKEGFLAPDTSVFIYPDSTVQINIKMQSIVGVTELPDQNEISYELKQNFPNPFNSTTTFYYILADDGYAEINIYDQKGELVENLFKGNQPEGEYKINWNADNLASGIYFYELKAGDIKLSKKCLLLK